MKITRDDLTALVAECVALQTGDTSAGYETPIAIDSFSFIWLQHQLDQRFDYDLQPPEGDIMATLDSAQALHRYLAGISPDRFATVDSAADSALDPEFEAALRECLGGLAGSDVELRPDSDLTLYGLDSLSIVRLMVTIEETFGVPIPDDAITFEIFSSPGALWKVVSGLREESHGR